MIGLYWFHACRRETPAQFLAVLRDGIEPPPPSVGVGTRQLELALGILPPRVYCFLGRTLDVFGHYAFAFRCGTAAAHGEVSPFDTGGLMNHLLPVSGWPNDRRQEYLRAFSWPHSTLETLLAAYPGASKEEVQRYLDLTLRPEHPGPHVPFAGRPEAEIWNQDADWRAWTWEGRWASRLPIRDELVAWTCPPALFPAVIDLANQAHQADELSWYQELMTKHISGGLGGLIAMLSPQQVPT